MIRRFLGKKWGFVLVVIHGVRSFAFKKNRRDWLIHGFFHVLDGFVDVEHGEVFFEAGNGRRASLDAASHARANFVAERDLVG